MIQVLDTIYRTSMAGEKMLAVLLDPDKFIDFRFCEFFANLPEETSHILVGGSTVESETSRKVIEKIRQYTDLPVVLFPGDYSQITGLEDAILFLSLISGRNPEYLIGQQIKAVPFLQNYKVQVIPTGYILIDGGTISAVQRVTGTPPLSQNNPEVIIHTAVAGELSGKKLIYLEAGSGARLHVHPTIISAVKQAINVPLIVGGGIRSRKVLEDVYNAGADMAVIGTAFEKGAFFLKPDQVHHRQ